MVKRDRRLNVMVSKEELLAFRRLAENRGVSVSDLVRGLVHQADERRKPRKRSR